MFGFGRKQDQDNVQIPYEVYETVQEPINRRRRWIVRLALALAVVTLLIFGGNALRGILFDDNHDSPASTSQEREGNTPASNKDTTAPEAANQLPQQNPAPAPTASSSVTMPQSSSDNNATVKKPE